MTWRMQTKIAGQSALTGSFTIPLNFHLTAQGASGSASYEVPVWSALDFTQQAGFGGPGTNVGSPAPFTGLLDYYVILGAFLVPITTITGGDGTHNATASIILYTAAGASVGTLFSKAYTTGNNATALVANSLGAPSTTVRSTNKGCLIRKNEVLTFKWAQSATTGLALVDAALILDIV